jgi:hypothetical protein
MSPAETGIEGVAVHFLVMKSKQFSSPKSIAYSVTLASDHGFGQFPVHQQASDARLSKSRGMRRTSWYAAVTRDESNAADDV